MCVVGSRESWELAVRGVELIRAQDANGMRGREIEPAAPVMVWGWAEIPSVQASWSPGCAEIPRIKDDGACAGWG